MAELVFSVVLKEIPVKIKEADGAEKIYKLKELTSAQRKKYNESFDVKVEMVDGEVKASAGDGFKMFSAQEFLALCLYDENDKLVPENVLADYPSTVTAGLHEEALKLSGLDKDSLETAKNELEGISSIGTE